MLKRSYDAVVVGAGIAGLLTALRLAYRGQRVLIVEGGRIGSGATTSNHGIIHSGSLMARLHPKVGRACREAQTLFVHTFPDALRTVRESWYFAEHERFEEFRLAWQQHGFQWQPIEAARAERWLRPEIRERSQIAAVYEPIVDPRLILASLAAACERAQVTIMTGVQVQAVVRTGSAVCGVTLASGDLVSAPVVVLAVGLGLHALLPSIDSRLTERLRSRVVAMAAYPQNGCDVSLMCLDFGGPTAVPVNAQTLLMGLYGGTQPPISGAHKRGTDMRMIAELERAVETYLQPGLVDLSRAVTWTGTKTEVATGGADAWGTEPSFFVANHRELDNLDGLVTAVPGKMSLAFHTSRAVLHTLGYIDEPLELQPLGPADASAIEHYPWEELLAQAVATPSTTSGGKVE